METLPEDSEEANSNTIFMQDGAPAHTSRMTMKWLEYRFPGRLVSSKSDFIWQPRFPYLNPLDFFMGLHEGRNTSSPPNSIAEVKQLVQPKLHGIHH